MPIIGLIPRGWTHAAVRIASQLNATVIMRRFLTLSLVLLALTGCHNRPVKVQTGGSMNFGGRMAMTGDLSTTIRNDNTASRLDRVVVTGNPAAACSVAVVDVDDLLVNRNLTGLGSMGENPVALFREKLEAIGCDPTVRALVLRIDTPGGGVHASDLMGHELATFRRNHPMPIIACIMSVGAGGGYYLACYADHIVAQPTSIVGGIGVILNTYNLEDALGQFNVVSIPVKSGEKIDLASPQRTMEPEERELLQAIADQMYEQFKSRVVAARPAIDVDAELWDGRVMTGKDAFESSLIDQVGYLDDAIEMARQMAAIGSDASVVMLRRNNDRAYTVLDKSPNSPASASLIPLNIPGLDRSSLPTFLYLWQAEPRFVTASGA